MNPYCVRQCRWAYDFRTLGRRVDTRIVFVRSQGRSNDSLFAIGDFVRYEASRGAY